MLITGYTTRGIAERNLISYSLSLSLSNTTGSGIFAFSGQNIYEGDHAHHPESGTPSRVHEFIFKEGKIYDPENRYFGSYQENSIVNISGNISGSKYNYYFNEVPVVFAGEWETGMHINNFCYDVSGLEMNADLQVKSPLYDYDITWPSTHIAGGLTGAIITNHTGDWNGQEGEQMGRGPTGLDFEVFSGEVLRPDEWVMTGWSSGIRTTGEVILENTGNDKDEGLRNHTIDYLLYTSFGNITGRATSLSQYSDVHVGTSFSVDTLSNQSTHFVETGISKSFNRGQHLLNHIIYENGTKHTGEKNIEVKLSNINTTALRNGYKVTGVQLAGIDKNGLYTGLPTVTFSSTGENDVQASATVLTGAYKSYDLTTGGTLPASPLIDSNVSFYTVTGLDVHTPGAYEEPTSITITFSGGQYEAATGVLAYQENGNSDSYYYSGSYGNIINSHIKQHPTGAVALTTTGIVFNRNLSNSWNLVTGTLATTTTGENLHSFNSGDSGIWPNNFSHAIYSSGLANQFTSGNNYVSGAFADGIKIQTELNHPLSNIGASELWPPTGITNREEGNRNIYVPIQQLKDAITGRIDQGRTAEFTLTYSFVKEGTRLNNDPNTAGTYIFEPLISSDDSISTSGEFTGEIGAAFSEWKALLEKTFNGLTVNFVNKGYENENVMQGTFGHSNENPPPPNASNTYTNLDAGSYNLPHASDSAVGDIRIGREKWSASWSKSSFWEGMTTFYSDTFLYNWYPYNYNCIPGVKGNVGLNIGFLPNKRIRLDSDASAPLGNMNDGTATYSLKYIATQAIGHILGLPDSTLSSSIMYRPTAGEGTFNVDNNSKFSTNFPNTLTGSTADADLLLYTYLGVVEKEHYIATGTTTEDHIKIETWNQPKFPTIDDVSARIITTDNYYSRYQDPSLIHTNTHSQWKELKDAITGTIATGGTATLDFKYSFINTGKQEIVYRSYFDEFTGNGVSVSQFTGEVGEAFDEWKNAFEKTFTGLTLNFTNNGMETGTGMYWKNNDTTSPYQLPNTEDTKIGDIRIGKVFLNSATSVSYFYNYNTGSILGQSGNVGGDIMLNKDLKYRLDIDTSTNSDSYSIKNVMCFQIGKMLGLDESDDPTSLMYKPMSGGASITTTSNFSGNFENGISGSKPDKDLLLHAYADADNHSSVLSNKNKAESSSQDFYSTTLSIKGSGSQSVTQIVTGGKG
tara:strand:- start:1709 stop:5302 length:3594 start_codon:yes stop_codon:yes gene_type:complete